MRKISGWVDQPPIAKSGDRATSAKVAEWRSLIEEIGAVAKNGEWAVIEYDLASQASSEKGWLTKQAALGAVPEVKSTVRGNKLYVSVGGF